MRLLSGQNIRWPHLLTPLPQKLRIRPENSPLLRLVLDMTTFSQKAWPEAQRYHFLEFVSSTSTMHRLERMDIESCCNKYVTASAKANLERCRDEYLRTKSKEDFLTMIYNIPSGFELRAKMVTNYQQLKTIYHQRRNHRLPDWQVFCDWIEGLPHSDLITGIR